MMKISGLVLLLSIASTTASAQTSALADLRWLAGCWQLENRERALTITEMWMTPQGNAMLGIGRTMKNSRLLEYEHLRIVEDDKGLAYISRPSANSTDTVFPLLRKSAAELVFENLNHDFPQRVIYRKLNKDAVHARIEGTANGKARGVDFKYARVKCE